jgi:hypothetical protein
MSLRRRPIETATYIPRNNASVGNNNNGFALTSSGALGFSDDIEKQLNYTSCKACPESSSNARTYSASAPSEKKKGSISCNRDAVASMQPFSSIMQRMNHTGAEAFGGSSFYNEHSEEEEEEDDGVHLGVPMRDVSKGMHKHDMHMALVNTEDGKHVKTEMELEKEIRENYLKYRTGGKVQNTQDLPGNGKLLHDVFYSFRRLMHMSKNKELNIDRGILSNISSKIKKIMTLWKTCKRLNIGYEQYAAESRLMSTKVVNPIRRNNLQSFKSCMTEYGEASSLVADLEQRCDCGLKKPTKQTAKAPGMAPVKSTPAVQMVPKAKKTGGVNRRSSIGGQDPSSSSTISSLRAMLQQKTRDMQMKLGAKLADDDHHEGGFCTCAEPQPVPISSLGGRNESSMYCQCEEPDPVPVNNNRLGESMYCTCETPLLKTGPKYPDNEDEEYDYDVHGRRIHGAARRNHTHHTHNARQAKLEHSVKKPMPGPRGGAPISTDEYLARLGY